MKKIYFFGLTVLLLASGSVKTGAQTYKQVYLQDFSNKTNYPSLSTANYQAIFGGDASFTYTSYTPVSPSSTPSDGYYSITSASAGYGTGNIQSHTDAGTGFFMFINAAQGKRGDANGAYFIEPLSQLNVPGATYQVVFYGVDMDQLNGTEAVKAQVGLSIRDGLNGTGNLYNTPVNNQIPRDRAWHQYTTTATIPTSFTASTLYFNFYNTDPTGGNNNGNDLGIDDISVSLVVINNLSGTVYTKDATGNGTSTTTYNDASTALYAVLVDNNNKVIQTQAVSSANGTYSFNSNGTGINSNFIPYATGNIGLHVILSGTNPAVGTANFTASVLNGNYVNTARKAAGASTATVSSTGNIAVVSTASDVSGLAFYVEQKPTSTTAQTIVPNNDTHVKGGILTDFPIPALQGADAEDYTAGGSLAGKTIIIQTLPTSGTLYYNGSPVTAGQTIANYDPAKLLFTSASGYSQPSFTFSYVDQAGAFSTPSTFTIVIPFNLPVVLQQFNGINQNGAVLLKWSTASEINAQSFEVQRSNDGGKTWSAIGTVNAVGNSTTVQQYSFTDIAPLATNQYRLNMIDADGSSEISKLIVAVNLGQNATSFKVIPNPITVNGHGKILLNAPLETKSELRIVDIAGRTVKTYPVAAGTQTVEFGTDGLAKGIYIVTLLTTNGVQHDKILIN